MIITPHMLTGAAIGSRARNAGLVFVFGWLSHYLLDFLPHWDYLTEVDITSQITWLKIGIDFLVGCSLVWVLIFRKEFSKGKAWLILTGILGALLPDLISVFYFNFGLGPFSVLISFHDWVHHWQGLSFWQGMPLTIMVSLGSICILLKKPRPNA